MTTRISEDLFLEMGELLNSNLDEVSILRTFCNKVLSLFDAERVSILALDPQAKNLTLTAWAGRYPEDMQGITVPIGEGVSGWVAATGESLLVPDVDGDPRFAEHFPGRYRTKSFISVPLKSRGKLHGVLNVTDTASNEGFTEDNLRSLKPLALQVGMGMENLRLRDQFNTLQFVSISLLTSLQDLNPGMTDIESGLVPAMISALRTALGPHSHLVIIGEMGANRAWLGKAGLDRGSEVSVMDFRSGFGLYQNLAALPTHPPLPENANLSELGFPWELVRQGRLQLVRNLLPPRHNLFGLALSAVPARSPEITDQLRNSQSILTLYSGLVMTGIFERAQIQKLDHLKTELISTVSHELRTPLTSIQGFSELVLRGDSLPEPKRRYISIIQNESKRLNRLINNFLDLARLESGQLSLIKEPLDSLQIVESAVKLLKPQSQTAKAAIRLHCEEDLPSLIADRDRVEQALVNLLGNAIKHGGTGVNIDIRVETSDGHTVFEIADDGPGIPGEEHRLVFNRFYRGILDKDDEEEGENKGTGLGLPLTKEIVEQHGGTISMESVPGDGTTLRISLPTQGLMAPQRGITAWHPGDENFSFELSNRVAEGKTAGIITVHINRRGAGAPGIGELSVEALNEIEDFITSTIGRNGMEDDFIQSRPQGEFVILTYASLVDDYAARLLETFAERLADRYEIAVGASTSEGEEELDADRLLTLSRQACLYIEKTQRTGYLKNRRM